MFLEKNLRIFLRSKFSLIFNDPRCFNSLTSKQAFIFLDEREIIYLANKQLSQAIIFFSSF
jgi:hypothetical protein